MAEFASLARDLADSLGALDRPRRVPVSQGAAETLILADAGGYSGPWSPEMVPYLKKPMDLLASRQHEAVCFVGPARTGKTAGLILGWMAHALTNDIGRMMVMHMTEQKAEELSKLDVEPAIESSPKLKALRSPYNHDNNIKLKIFRHGMAIKFAYPTPSHLAGGTYRYVALTDYDRFPAPRGAGEIFDNAHKRTETAMSRRMTLVESSPEREIEDPHWAPSSPHEAPPVGGILGIYNRGDRQRWYWPCPHCREYFEASPGLDLFASLPPEEDLLESIRGANIAAMAKKHAIVFCPHCGAGIEPKHKHAMNTAGVWVMEGQTVDRDGNLSAIDAPPAQVASFWLGGVSAAYQSWESIVRQYLYGLHQYVMSGSEETLRKSTFTDQAMPYRSRSHGSADESRIESRLEELPQYHVPEWARCLIAAVDVQGGAKSRFVVQVHAIGPHMESAIVDRYDIITPPRDADARIDPAGYPEDWDALTARVIDSTYKVSGDEELKVLHTAVDTGGEKGVSTNAYAWLRRLRYQGKADRVTLVKGDTIKPMIQKTFARDERGRRMRDVPLLLVNTDGFKDMISASIRRVELGPAYMHFPSWLKSWFFDELRSEKRQPNGKWVQIRARNEALDLWVYIWAIAWMLGLADPSRPINWDDPPPWAAPLDRNIHRMTREERRQHQESKPTITRRRTQWL